MKISTTNALVVAVTTIGENHGDDVVPAIAVKLEFTVPPRQLTQFSKDLGTLLFEENQIPRMPLLGTLEWKGVYEKVKAFIDAEEFKGVDVKKITFGAREGFVIDMGLTVKLSKPTAAERGRLTGLIKKEVKVVLENMQLRLDAEEEEEDEPQPDLPGTPSKTPPITPLIGTDGKTKEERDAERTKH